MKYFKTTLLAVCALTGTVALAEENLECKQHLIEHINNHVADCINKTIITEEVMSYHSATSKDKNIMLNSASGAKKEIFEYYERPNMKYEEFVAGLLEKHPNGNSLLLGNIGNDGEGFFECSDPTKQYSNKDMMNMSSEFNLSRQIIKDEVTVMIYENNTVTAIDESILSNENSGSAVMHICVNEN